VRRARELDAARRGHGSAGLYRLVDDRSDVELALLEREIARARLSGEQEILDQAEETLGVAIDHLEPVHLRGGKFRHDVVLQKQLEVAADRRQRRAKLVRDEGDELVLHSIELAEPFVLLL